MTLSGCRAYFKTRMLALGYKELPHKGFWDPANLPKTIIDGGFHLEMKEMTPRSVTQAMIPIEVPATIRVLRKSGADEQSGIDKGFADADKILLDLCKGSNATTGVVVKGVFFRSGSLDPLNDQNDNVAVLTMNFVALIFVAT